MSFKNLSEKNRATLLVALHELIENSAEKNVEQLESLKGESNIFYPSNGGLSDVEREAGKAMIGYIQETPGAKMFLRKVFANNSAEILFTLFNWIDGTEDPSGPWTGVDLVDTSGEDKEMLHDALLESYWDWKKIRPIKEWSLDLEE